MTGATDPEGRTQNGEEEKITTGKRAPTRAAGSARWRRGRPGNRLGAVAFYVGGFIVGQRQVNLDPRAETNQVWKTTFGKPCLETKLEKPGLERETGIEPVTSSLGSWRSTAELLPLNFVRLPSRLVQDNGSLAMLPTTLPAVCLSLALFVRFPLGRACVPHSTPQELSWPPIPYRPRRTRDATSFAPG